jgi:hypothetical protein
MELVAKLTLPEGVRVETVETGKHTRVQEGDGGTVLRVSPRKTKLLTQEAFAGLAKAVSFPQRLIDTTPRPWVLQGLNYLMAGTSSLAVVSNSEEIRAVVPSGGFVPVRTDRVLKTLEKSVGGTGLDLDGYMDPKTFGHVIHATGPETREVVKGDLVRAGVTVEYSPVGTVVPHVEAYAVRLVCTNGMTHTEHLRDFHGHGEGDDFWQAFRKQIRDSYRAIGSIVQRLNAMREQLLPPEQVALAVEAMLRDVRLPKEAAEAFRAMVMNNPPRNMYDLYNHLTDVASHVVGDMRTRHTVLRRGAVVAEAAVQRGICPVCHHEHALNLHSN